MQHLLPAAVLRLERFECAGHLTGGPGFELLLPEVQRLRGDAQFGGDLPGGLALIIQGSTVERWKASS